METTDVSRPQDDLYRWVNHEWLTSNVIPSDRGSYGVFHELRDRAEADVRNIIEQAVARHHQRQTNNGSSTAESNGSSTADSSDEEAARDARIAGLWDSFMDEERIEALGTSPVADLLEKIENVHDVEHLMKLAGEFATVGIEAFFSIGASNDAKDPEVNLFTILQGGIGLPDEAYYREDAYQDIREAYRAHIERMLSFFAYPDPAGTAIRIFDLETAIAKHHWDIVKTRDAQARYNKMNSDELLELAPLLRNWFDGSRISEKYWSVVDVWQPSFLEGLNKELIEQPLEVWKELLAFNVMRARAPYLNKDVVTENWSFYSHTLGGATEQRERWKRGVAFVESGVGEDIGQIFVAEHFPPAAKERMDHLVDRLIEAYRTSMNGLDWMGEDTQKRALIKLEKFRTKIGYPSEWIDYSTLEVDPENLAGNVAAIAQFTLQRELKKIEDGVNRELWFMYPQTVNAYYHPLLNEIAFPAAILRPPFFDLNGDDATNFGAIGAVIGHEIGHGFDDQGSRFDGDGTLTDWWTEDDRNAFEARTKNLVEQYGALVPPEAPEHTVNGELTLGENIGDLGGLGIAHKAYLAEMKATGRDPEEETDGLSGNQRFFTSWARVWASLTRPESMVTMVSTDPHSPTEFRANQTARNVDAFHEAFGTKEGDGMWLAPEERVSIW